MSLCTVKTILFFLFFTFDKSIFYTVNYQIYLFIYFAHSPVIYDQVRQNRLTVYKRGMGEAIAFHTDET